MVEKRYLPSFCTIMIDIQRIKSASEDVMRAMGCLLPQLSTSATIPTAEYVEQLLAREDTQLLVARNEQGEIVGMLTLLFVALPTSRKAWIEDVVTDAESRGCGVGQALVEEAIAIARNEGAKRIYLTSNPTRAAAHRLYRRCGFEQYETAVFRLEL